MAPPSTVIAQRNDLQSKRLGYLGKRCTPVFWIFTQATEVWRGVGELLLVNYMNTFNSVVHKEGCNRYPPTSPLTMRHISESDKKSQILPWSLESICDTVSASLFIISLEYSGPSCLKVLHLYNLKHSLCASVQANGHRRRPRLINFLPTYLRASKLVLNFLGAEDGQHSWLTLNGRQPTTRSTSIWSNYSCSCGFRKAF